jgi:uncharacterized protein with PIN domain
MKPGTNYAARWRLDRARRADEAAWARVGARLCAERQVEQNRCPLCDDPTDPLTPDRLASLNAALTADGLDPIDTTCPECRAPIRHTSRNAEVSDGSD